MSTLAPPPEQGAAAVLAGAPQGGGDCVAEELTIAYRSEGRWLRAVRELSFAIAPGEALAVVGETGSGKSSSGYAVMAMLPRGGRVLAGSVRVAGTDVLTLGERALRGLRGKVVGYVPQQPSAAFNPTRTIGKQVAETLVVHEGLRYRDTLERVSRTLTDMGLAEPERVISSYPHQLSGGMLQRAMIAGAIIGNPRLLVADEPTSALDVSVQRQILELLGTVRTERGLSILLITHDLGAVAQLANTVLVMYAGRKVECGPVDRILSEPRHPYTRGLIESRPGRGQPHKARLAALPGAPLGPAEVDSEPGCPFRVRCSRAVPACASVFPEAHHEGAHSWFCHNPLENGSSGGALVEAVGS